MARVQITVSLIEYDEQNVPLRSSSHQRRMIEGPPLDECGMVVAEEARRAAFHAHEELVQRDRGARVYADDDARLLDPPLVPVLGRSLIRTDAEVERDAQRKAQAAENEKHRKKAPKKAPKKKPRPAPLLIDPNPEPACFCDKMDGGKLCAPCLRRRGPPSGG